MSTATHLKTLRTFGVLSHLSDAQLEELASHVATRSLKAGELLLETGQVSQEVCFVVSGELKTERKTAYGRFALAAVAAGDLVGEAAIIDRQEMVSDVIAASETDLLVLQAATFESPDSNRAFELALFWAFWKSLSNKLRAANQKLSLFFSSEVGQSAERSSKPSSQRSEDLSSTLDLAAKRGLFEEQPLSAMEINFLATLSKEEQFETGEEIFRQGEPGLKMYVVVGGQVMISTVVPGGGEEALSFLERGEFFGEMALIDGQPRSADARATKANTVLLGISREVLEGILDIEKVSSLRLLKLLCGFVASRLRSIDEKLTGWFVLAGGELSREEPT